MESELVMSDIKKLKEEELEKVNGGNSIAEYDFLGNNLNEGDAFLIKNYRSQSSKLGLVVAKNYKDPSNSTIIECVKFNFIVDLNRVTHLDHRITRITYGELISDYEKRIDILINVPRFD